MTQHRRRRLVAPLLADPVALPPGLAHRHPAREDLESLAALMLDAYRGTIDDAGETLADAIEEVTAYLAGGPGEPLLECSFLALDGSRPVGACLVSLHQNSPLLAYAFTAPAAQNRGLATALIRLSMRALAARGYRRLALWVTEGNTPAERVYEKLGFTPAGSGPLAGST